MMMKRKLLSTPGRRRWPWRRPAAQAQISDGVIKIGVLNDMSGLYADIGGPGSVVAARWRSRTSAPPSPRA
jgi:branched-chain amino acid transport system substrate-binding protein